MNKREIIDIIRDVLRRHSYVVRADLFGSLARGDVRNESDIDIVVVYDENRPKGLRAFSIVGEMERALGRKVDIVQEHLLYGVVKDNIKEDRERIYER